jgi:hypothetical protein
MTYAYFRRNDDKAAFTRVFTRYCFFWYYVGRNYLASILESAQEPLDTIWRMVP